MNDNLAMKETELRAHSTCSICKRPVMHTCLPLFWTLRVVRYGIDIAAVNRQTALATLLGGSAQLAMAIGPDEDMALPILTATVVLCEQCMLTHTGNLPGYVFDEE